MLPSGSLRRPNSLTVIILNKVAVGLVGQVVAICARTALMATSVGGPQDHGVWTIPVYRKYQH